MNLLLVITIWLGNPQIENIERVLDKFHQAATDADARAYFSCLAPDAVFIGTDASETWTKQEFEDFCQPYFSQQRGWTYIPKERQVSIDPTGKTAWFVEMLENESYGQCRGTGVLLKGENGWLIVQYHLTIPIPNSLAKNIVSIIREAKKSE